MKGVEIMSTRKPIYVFEGGGTNPHVIATIDTDKFSDHDSKAETAVISRKVNNISTIELIIPTNCEASKAITNTSDLVLFDTKGDIQEFHITDVDDLDEYSVNRTIYAEQSFGELINNIITSETPMPTTTNPVDYLAYILYFTRWSVGTVESGIYNSKWEENITGLTCLEAFQKLVDKYNCEFVIRYETDGKNKIIGRYVDLKKKIGSNLGKRFEDSKDIIGLKRTLDLDSVKTAIYPRIKLDSQDENGNSKTTYIDISSVAWSVAKGDPVDKPIGQTIIVNPDADAMHKRYNTKTGNLMEKIMYAEWTGDTAKDAEDLCRQAWSILKANGVLTPTIEVTASDLYRMSGNNPDYSHEQVSLGDTCIIIDKNFEPELRLTTRVMEIEEDILNPVNNTYVFGNYRKTLATSNIESQKSIEEQLGQLQDKIQGITIPEYSLPYQSGKDYYNDVKAQIQNEFMSASGYVMAQDSDGFWVFDAPIPDDREATYPTKATILKGGCVALAKYNPVTSTWEVGTFINGTTVNADYITAGHLNANVIAAGSITTKHLNTAAIEYIKTGMATDADLQGVVDSVASTYATKDSVTSNINNAVKGLVSTNDMNSAISSATKDLATKDSVSSNINNAVKDLVSTSTMNSAITNATKDMATNSSVNSAINNVTKDMATNSSVNTAIGNATSGLASKDYVNGAVSTITIGGRNIAIKTNQGTTGWGWSMKTGDAKASSFVDENGVDCCKLTRGNEAQTGWSVIWYTYINRIMYKTNTKYTVSFEVKSSVTSGNINCSLRLSNSSGSLADSSGVNMGGIPTANTWIKLSCVLTTVSKFPTDTNQVLYLTGFNSNVGVTYIFRNLKIEEGTKATAWTPAPEDIEEQNRLARINAIKDLQKQLQSEYNENIAKANKVYVDKYLPAGSTAKVNLNNKMTAYTTSYNNYNKYITTMIADGTVTEAEYTQYNTYATAYADAIKGLAEAIEDANSARLANVYAQARQGLVTTAELEVNNKSVIASAKAGMVSTGDMTGAITAATENLVSNDALNDAIADFTTTSDVDSAISTATKDMATNSSVNSAVANATKDMATNSSVNSAISSATKDMATTTIMNSAITNATKDMATNSSVNTAVTNATKDMATNSSVNNAIGNLQIGGRNLIKNSAFTNGISGWVHTSNNLQLILDNSVKLNGHPSIKISNTELTQNYWFGVKTYSNLVDSTIYKGVTYTLSCWYYAKDKTTIDSNLTLQLKGKKVNATGESSIPNAAVMAAPKDITEEKWTKISVTFTPTETFVDCCARAHFDKNGTAWVTDFKLEKGSKATDWTPAPEDTTSEIKTATKDMATNTSVNSAINNATKDMATNSSVNNAVNNATKDMATNKGVTDAINGVTVGSRNLALLTSDDWVSFTGFKGGVNDCRLKYKVLTSGLSAGDKLLIALDYKLENMTYAASGTPIIKMQGSGDVTSWNSGSFYGMFIPNVDKKPANAEGTAYVISTINSDHIKNTYWNCNFRTDYLTGGTVSIRRIRVVRSSKLIDWTAAPEDAYTTTVEETFKAITAEYNNNYKIATTLYLNTYLDGTAKTNLKAAYDDYKNKYNAVKGAHDAILFTGFGYAEGKSAWNTSLTNLQASTSTLGVRVQEASTYINTAIYNASKTYTDKAIPDALTGYAKTSYVDSAKADAIADAKKGMVSTSQLEVNNTEILLKSASMGQYNILRNTDFRDNMNYWKTWGTDAKETIKVVGETATAPGAAMSGEKNLVIMGANDATTGGKNIGFCQETNKCVVGVSYTVGYWVNCTGCSCVVQIESIDSKNTVSLLVKKSYQNINGGHDRATWKYDSLTFTVPKGSAKINFVVQLTYASAATHRVLLVKPMMTTGINAQAWTAHPDEIHVGVVSVTEQNGIKVEHSDFNTYTTLNASGLKVYNKKDNSMIASFGESGSAYIGNLNCNGYVNAPQLMPLSKRLPQKTIVSIYCSETGSGNGSGDSKNYAMGWVGAMRKVLDTLGIDYTHTDGRFIIDSRTRSLLFKIYIKGATFTNDIELYNVYGSATFQIYFDAGCKFTGQMRFYNIEPDILIDGNKTAILYRGSNTGAAIWCDNVNSFNLFDIYINYATADNSNTPIYMYNTRAKFSTVDFCNCDCMAAISDCFLKVASCCGGMEYYISNGERSFFLWSYSGTKAPAVTSTLIPYGSAFNLDNVEVKPTPSVQKGASSVTINVTKTFNANYYYSKRGKDYVGRSSVLIQSAPTQEEADRYGWYVGEVYFSDTEELPAYIAKVNNPVLQVFLERGHSINIPTDSVDIYIDGEMVGSLSSEKSGWFTLPSATVTALKNGTRNYIQLNATETTNYTEYKMNSVLKVTGTQTL